MKKNLNGVAQEVKKVYFDTDVAMKFVPKVCGGAGCSHCCHQNIRVHFGEGPVIERYIKQDMDPTTKEVVKTNLTSWLAYFDQHTPNGRPVTDTDLLVFETQIAQDRMPCFFLVDGRCAIYKVRPLVCRTHCVNDSPNDCAANAHRNGDPAGIEIQKRKIAEISRVSDMFGVRPMAYAVQESLGLRHSCKPLYIEMAPTLTPVR